MLSNLPETSHHIKAFSFNAPWDLTSYFSQHTHAGLLCIVTIIKIGREILQMLLFGSLGCIYRQRSCLFLVWTVKDFNSRCSVLCLLYIFGFGTIRLRHTFNLCPMSLFLVSFCCFPICLICLVSQLITVTFCNITWFLRDTEGNYSLYLALWEYMLLDCLSSYLHHSYFHYLWKNWEKESYVWNRSKAREEDCSGFTVVCVVTCIPKHRRIWLEPSNFNEPSQIFPTWQKTWLTLWDND